MEGTASYAGTALVPDRPWADSWLQLWHQRPDRALGRRDYDALGLYETVEDLGSPDVWRFMVQLLQTDTPEVPLAAVLNPEIAGHWGAQYHDNTELGPYFFLAAQHGSGPRVTNIELRPDGPTQQLPVPALGAVAIAIGGLGGDNVLRFESTSPGTIKFSAEPDPRSFQPGVVRHACFSDVGCTPCPDGAGPRLARVDGTKAFVGTASVEGGRFQATLLSHDRACGIEPTPTTVAGPCHLGRWVSTDLLAPAAPNEVRHAGADGVVLVLGADGRMTLDFAGMNPFVVELEGPDHGEVIHSELIFIGSGASPYRVVDGKLSGSAIDLTQIQIRSTVQVDNGPVVVGLDRTLAELVGAGGGDGGAVLEGSTLGCDGTTLRLTRTTTAGVVGWGGFSAGPDADSAPPRSLADR